MFEVMTALLFICMFLMAMGNFALQHFFFRRLKNDHPQTWEKLGRPTQFLNKSIANGLVVRRFIKREEYKTLGDEKFTRLIHFTRWYHRIYFAIFGTFIVLFFVKLWNR